MVSETWLAFYLFDEGGVCCKEQIDGVVEPGVSTICPGSEVIIKSNVFCPLVGKCTTYSNS